MSRQRKITLPTLNVFDRGRHPRIGARDPLRLETMHHIVPDQIPILQG